MNILIFGASGGTGRHLVSQGLKKGHHLTAFVRDPSRLQITDDNLSIVQGNILNKRDVEDAITGKDIVISVLGSKTSVALWKPNNTISKGVKNIISGMNKHGVSRLLFVTSFGVDENIFLPEKVIVRSLLKNLFIDIPKQEQLIMQSGLDWTIVHPARLVNSPRTGRYKAGEELRINPLSKIARADVADFLLNNLQNRSVVDRTVTLKY